MAPPSKTSKTNASSGGGQRAPATVRETSGAGFDFEDQTAAWQLVKALSGEQAPGDCGCKPRTTAINCGRTVPRPPDSSRMEKLTHTQIMGSTDDPKWLREGFVGQPSAGSSHHPARNQLPVRGAGLELHQSLARSRS